MNVTEANLGIIAGRVKSFEDGVAILEDSSGLDWTVFGKSDLVTKVLNDQAGNGNVLLVQYQLAQNEDGAVGLRATFVNLAVHKEKDQQRKPARQWR